MKRTIFKTMAVLMAVLACLSLHAVNSITYTTAYNDSALTLGTDTLGGVTYSTISYEGLYNGGAPGTPSLPIDYIRFSVPWNATNFTVSATTINNPIQPLGYQLYPNQMPQLMSDTIGWSITLPDSSAYQNNVFYPTNRAWVVDEGFLAGENHIVTVAVMPVDYRHRLTSYMDQHQYRLSRAVNLTLSYELSDTLAMYPIVRQNTTLRSEGYRLAQSMVVNPENVTTHAPTSVLPMDSLIVINPNGAGDGLNGHDWPSYPIDSTGLYLDSIPTVVGDEQMATYPYLIVTTPELKHAVRRIAALKNQKGLRTMVVTIDEVLNSPFSGQGDVVNHVLTYTDDAGKLRQYLRYCYANLGTEYVLLAGSDIPYKSIIMHPRSVDDQMPLQTDLYFCDLNANWLADTIDKCSELYVGRIIAKSDEQITNYADKLFRYELNPGKGSRDYLKRALYSEGYDMRKNGETEKVRVILDTIFPYPVVMQETDDYTAHTQYPSGKDIVDEINENGYAFLSFHHHGYPSALLTSGLRTVPDTNRVHWDSYRFLWANDYDTIADTGWYKDDKLSGNGLNNLTNKYYPSICYSIACETIPFELPLFYKDKGLNMNFGESFTTGKDYGGPIFIGNTYKGFTPTSALLERSVAEELLTGHNNIIGKVNCHGKMKFNTTYGNNYDNYIIAVQNLLGDPSVEIWTDVPSNYFDVIVEYSDSTITIRELNNDSMNVAICDNNGKILTGTSNPSPQVFNISPNSTINFFKYNHIPYIAPLVLQNILLNHSHYIIASDVTAGNAVDDNRSYGFVTVKSGTEYEIEASGTVTLNDGFKVERGATFAVYPSCF